jgi:acyl-CoA reductase-like NAD-dependent aldehyde dehydrogenase
MILDLSTTEASASDEVIFSLNAINQLYEELSFPATLAKERSIQAGKNAPTNLVPVGPALISASPHCPLSSIIIPLAAAIAAGSCSLIVLNDSSLRTNKELRNIIDTSLDQDAIGVAPEGKSWDDAEICSLRFGVAVLQNLESSSDIAARLRIANPAIRIHAPSSGHPALFVDRSTPDLEAVASIIADHVIQAPRKHTGRIPRICFVDEFIIDALAQKVYNILSERHTERLNQVKSSELTQLIGNTFHISQQSAFTSPGSNDIANLIVVNKNRYALLQKNNLQRLLYITNHIRI